MVVGKGFGCRGACGTLAFASINQAGTTGLATVGRRTCLLGWRSSNGWHSASATAAIRTTMEGNRMISIITEVC